jgi:phospholipid/cholesterol/gamma-HCH transport system ATP-binding protein
MAADTPPLIRLERVCLEFGRQRVLHDITVHIPRGQTVAVIGESGCGKTVFLKLIIGLLSPTSGTVIFDGKELAKLSDRDLTQQRLRFGFLFQGAALFDSLSVYDNVAFGLREQRRLSEKEIEQTVAGRLQEIGLPRGIETKKPAELSGGMKKRVGLARALALNPEVMLYDEPTTGLDPIMSDVIGELIVQTRQRSLSSGPVAGGGSGGAEGRRVTSLVVTHDMKTVHKVADRVVMLYPLGRLKPEEPQVLYDGPPAGLASCPDERVRQFVEGAAGERLRELAENA